MYYSLDITNDSEEAMQAKEYFDSQEDFGVHRRASVQTNGLEVGSHALPVRTDYDHMRKTQKMALHAPQPNPNSNPSARAPSVISSSETGEVVVESLAHQCPTRASRANFYEYLFTDGNWTDLFATSVAWMLLDFTFFMLGVNSSSFIPTMFGEHRGPLEAPYHLLTRNERHIMESTSIGALLGCILAIVIMQHYSRKKLQMWGFLILGILFTVVGSLYMTLPTTNADVVIVVFYGICQLFYNFGM